MGPLRTTGGGQKLGQAGLEWVRLRGGDLDQADAPEVGLEVLEAEGLGEQGDTWIHRDQ